MGDCKGDARLTRYHVHITPAAIKEIRRLPGHIKQRIIRTIDQLSKEPRPPKSVALKTTTFLTLLSAEPRRLRMDRWRIIYVVTDEDRLVDILAIRKRPPYDYGDLTELLSNYTL